jgi:uroporphyrin-III C-methyltransferase/precorrin-2 dehydrogenase/sirohydrochlorin ferrochelatase
VFDDMVPPVILDFARREAKKMLLGTTETAMTVALAKAGRRVVRLKAGAGRAGEEIAACRAGGIAVEVVPGVTAVRPAITSQAVADLKTLPIGNRQAQPR